MAAPFYTLNHVPLSFTVTDCCGAVNPISAIVNVYDPCLTQIVCCAVACVTSNTVSYTIVCSVHTIVGSYVAEFDITLPCCEVRTHPITYKIVERPSVP
jgi:hypothetical protein